MLYLGAPISLIAALFALANRGHRILAVVALVVSILSNAGVGAILAGWIPFAAAATCSAG